MNLVSNLLKDKKYLDIINLVRENKVNLWDRIVFNQIIKVFVYHNDPVINKILIEEYPQELIKNMDGRMPFHVMYEQGNDELIKKFIAKYPNYIEAVNLKEGTNFINSIISLGDTNMLNFVLKVNPGININRHTSSLASYLLSSIRLNKNGINNNDPNSYSMINLLLKNGANPNLQKPTSCFQYIANNIPNCTEIVKLLLNYGGNINTLDIPTLFMISHAKSNHKFLEILFAKNSGYIFTVWDILYCLKNNSVDTKVTTTIIYNVDADSIRHFRGSKLNNILTYAVIENADPVIISHLIPLVDVNSPNYSGKTFVHYLFKSNKQFLYEKILENTFINIFQKSASGEMPIDYINDKDYPRIIDLFTKGYMSYHKINKLKINLECIKDIKKNIFNHEECIPKINKINKIVIPEPTNYVLGISSPVSLIDIIIFCNKILVEYSTLICAPSIDVKNIDICNNLSIIDFPSDTINDYALGSIITPLNGILFKKYLPSIIICRNSIIEYSFPTIQFYVHKAVKNTAQFIMFTVVYGKNHYYITNMLFNKSTNVLELYDLENFISTSQESAISYVKNIIEQVINEKVTISQLNVKLATMINKISLVQRFSVQDASIMFNLWFIEIRLKNPNIPQNSFLIELLLDEVGFDVTEEKFAERLFNYFRSYFEVLTKYKHSIYKKSGVNDFDLYNVQFTYLQKENISKNIDI